MSQKQKLKQANSYRRFLGATMPHLSVGATSKLWEAWKANYGALAL